MRANATMRALTALGLGLAYTVISGCVLGTLVGGMAESAYLAGSHKVYSEYEGLGGKSFAVVVAVDRAIESEAPGLAARITGRVNTMIAQAHSKLPDGATAAPRVDRLLKILYNNPSWVAMPRSDVAQMLGVDRLIVIDIAAYRLHDPGNTYLWAGVAAGTVSVYEADGPLPDDAAFEKAVSVSFPDGRGYMVTDIPFEAVNTELSNRFASRLAWLFFDHEEPNEMNY